MSSIFLFLRDDIYLRKKLTEPSVIHGRHAPAFDGVEFQLVVTPVRANYDYPIVFRRRERRFAKTKRILWELAHALVALTVVVPSRGDPSYTVAASVHAKLRERSFSLQIFW